MILKEINILNLRKLLIIITIIIFNLNDGVAQHFIFGKLTDKMGKPIPFGNIILKNTDQEILTFCFSDSLGIYHFSTNSVGKLLIVYSALSYNAKEIEIELDSSFSRKGINISLEYKQSELKEVIVTSSIPIVIKNDTIVFDAKFFSQGNEKVLEDLLRKIPGLSVSDDGVIKVGNQEVEKIMIEGDDFFNKSYRLLTRNMPPSPVSKIEVIKNYTENKLLKGLDHSNLVALNLKLQDSLANKWFGDVNNGIDVLSFKKYDANLNLMSFRKKSKYYFLGSSNNIGEDQYANINEMMKPFPSDEDNTINVSANRMISINATTALNNKRTHFNNLYLGSLNTIHNLLKHGKLKVSLLFEKDANDYFRNYEETINTGSIHFTNKEDISVIKHKLLGFGKLEFSYDISNNQNFEISTKFSKGSYIDSSNLLFNSLLIKEKLTTNSDYFTQSLSYTRKFSIKKVLLIKGIYFNEILPQQYFIDNNIYASQFPNYINANALEQQSAHSTKGSFFQFKLITKLNEKSNLDVEFANSNNTSYLQSAFQFFENSQFIGVPMGYDNDFKMTTNDFYFQYKYRFAIKKIIFSNQQSAHFFKYSVNSNDSKIQNNFFINSMFNVELPIGVKSKLLASYSNANNYRSFDNVYLGYILTNYRQFNKGTNLYSILNGSTLLMSYTYGSWIDKSFLNFLVLSNWNNKYNTTNTLVNNTYANSISTLDKNKKSISFNTDIDHFIKPVSNNIKITFSVNSGEYRDMINNTFRLVNSFEINYGLEFRSIFKSFFNYHIGTKWGYSQFKTPVISSFNSNFTFLDFNLKFNKNLFLKFSIERFLFTNLSNKTFYFSDLNLNYTIPKSRIELSGTVNNIFNSQNFIKTYASDLGLFSESYRLLPRFALVRIRFKF